MRNVTELLVKATGGDPVSLERLYSQVYAELRAIAVQKMASERPDHTLQPTALVHEAFLRLGGGEAPQFQNRAHFFAAAAEAMRRILVDSARRSRQLKRGGDQERVEPCETRLVAPDCTTIYTADLPSSAPKHWAILSLNGALFTLPAPTNPPAFFRAVIAPP